MGADSINYRNVPFGENMERQSLGRRSAESKELGKMKRVAILAVALLGFGLRAYAQGIHDVGETLPHFLATEHVAKHCIDTKDKSVNSCTLFITDQHAGQKRYYSFRNNVLARIEVSAFSSSYQAAVADITKRYGKPTSQDFGLQLRGGVAEGSTTFWKTSGSRVWVTSMTSSDLDGNTFNYVRIVVLSDVEYAAQGLGDKPVQF
jgi:hypothetical protein